MQVKNPSQPCKPHGHFLGVVLGITAYGVVTAFGVRDANWSAR
ncbi:hypothetical protein RA280_03555 [Cupriavidus sp. CV2]|nr:hypothetical protein [Cupriavidus sp. CV2]MDW3680833.1 hypothetical protein [Cupriavidus sp. CV2]